MKNFNKLSKLFTSIFFLLAISLAPISQAQANSKYASLVIDADTGVVLSQENAGKYRYPASLVKMMTLYLTFQAIETGRIGINQKLKVSSRAAAQPPSKLRLKRGQRIKTKEAILAVAIKSANDAAVVLAESVGGSEWQFVTMMNRMAKKLGLNHTQFRNASGLHDKRQKTTTYDMARLAVALRRDYPKYYYLFDKTKFYFNGKLYRSHNHVAKTYAGADGLKTGYIRASGYNLITSARRNGRSIVGVVMGGRTTKRRDSHMKKILDQAFYKMAKSDSTQQVIYTGTIPTPSTKPGENAQAFAPLPILKPGAKIQTVVDNPVPEPKPDVEPKIIKSSQEFG